VVSIALVVLVTVAAAAEGVRRRLCALSSDQVQSRQPMRDEAQRQLPMERHFKSVLLFYCTHIYAIVIVLSKYIAGVFVWWASVAGGYFAMSIELSDLVRLR
jgi:hypothetical protein